MEERRKQNKQITIEKIEKELSQFATKDELKEAVKVREKVTGEILEKINYDGGLVYQCDMRKYDEKNTRQHKDLKDDINRIHNKLEEIYPKVKEDIKVADAYKTIGDAWGSNLKSNGFWIKVIIGFGVFVGLIILFIEEVKKMLKF